MKRKFFALILVLALVFTMALPAGAVCGTTRSFRLGRSFLANLCVQYCRWICTQSSACPTNNCGAGTEKPVVPPVAEDPVTPPVAQDPVTPPVAEEPAPEKPIEEPAPEKPDTETPVSDGVLDFEREVVTLVNAERAANGLAPLTLSADLCAKARVKSEDMAQNNYFSHTSPTYGSPFDMMKSFGITYRSAGENIAAGYASPAAVVSAWMNSAGHRANILSASFTTIGVGYVASGNHWTQWFIS